MIWETAKVELEAATGKGGERARILQRTGDLFYRLGFSNTGIREIETTCGITRPTLYHYFGSKQGVGLAYLDLQIESFVEFVRQMRGRNKTLSGFFRSWSGAILLAARRGRFNGCPFTGFAAQLSMDDRKSFAPRLETIQQRWIREMQVVFDTYIDGTPRAQRANFVEDVMVAFTGVSNLYLLTRDRAILGVLLRRFNEIAKKYDAGRRT